MPLTTEDRALIERLRDSGRVVLPDTHRVTDAVYFRQGNFTIAFVTVRVHKRLTGKNIKGNAKAGRDIKLAGVAKRNCNDDDENPRRGADIALTRALRGDAKPIIDPTVSLAT